MNDEQEYTSEFALPINQFLEGWPCEGTEVICIMSHKATYDSTKIWSGVVAKNNGKNCVMIGNGKHVYPYLSQVFLNGSTVKHQCFTVKVKHL